MTETRVTGIAILLWSADCSAPQRLATPFFHAAAAAAMDLQVEIYFSAASVMLLKPGVADALRPTVETEKSILDSLLEAHAHGAILLACTDALHAHGLRRDGLIAQCAGHGGAIQFMARAADPAWRALVF